MKQFIIVLCLLFFQYISGEKSLAELDAIFLNKEVQSWTKRKHVDSLLSIIKPLKENGIVDIIFELPPLCVYQKKEKICAGTYIPFNPSIIKIDKGYYVTCRTGDYRYPNYASIIRGVAVRNKQFFLTYDKNFVLQKSQEMPPLSGEILQKVNTRIQFEDTRLMRIGNAFWMSGTVSLARKSYLPKFTLSELDISDTGLASLHKTILFLGPEEARWEKNWMHMVENGKLRFIYSYDPLIVLEPDLDSGTCKEVFRHNTGLDFSRFRGSAAPIEFGDGYLMVVHELMRSTRLSKGVFEKHYTHRFLYLDKGYKITKISLPFKFEGDTVEYCTSMTFDHSGKNLVFAVGVHDSKAKLFLYDPEYVQSLLTDIPQLS